MGLTGKAKKDYQRDYMKKKRSNKTDGSNMVGLTEDVARKVKAREITRKGMTGGMTETGGKLTELPFSKAKQAKSGLPGTVWSVRDRI